MAYKYFECGCCGEYHAVDLPGYVDCRADASRFSHEDLEAMEGPNYIFLVKDLEEQMREESET